MVNSTQKSVSIHPYDPEKLDFKNEYGQLLDILNKGTCIFVGAGVSKLAGYKLWKELADDMVREYWKTREKMPSLKNYNYSIMSYLLSCNIPIEVMDYLYGLDNDFFFKVLEQNFSNSEIKTDVYEKFTFLSSINDCFFIQTNIDKSFQDSLKIQDNRVSINPEFLDGKKIFYLHGRLDNRSSLVFTSRHYNDNYLSDKSAIMDFLIPIFKKYSVLFLGYSLRDYEVLQAIYKARMNGMNQTHYLLEPVYNYKLTEFEIKKQNTKNTYGIEIIPYNIEVSGYESLLNILDKLGNAVSSAKSPIKFNNNIDKVENE